MKTGWISLTLLALAACDQRWDDLRMTGQQPFVDAAAGPVDAAVSDVDAEPPPIDAEVADLGFIDLVINNADYANETIRVDADATYRAGDDNTRIHGTGMVDTTGTVTLDIVFPGDASGSFDFGTGVGQAAYSLEIVNGARSLSMSTANTGGNVMIISYGPVGLDVEGRFSGRDIATDVRGNYFHLIRRSDQP